MIYLLNFAVLLGLIYLLGKKKLNIQPARFPFLSLTKKIGIVITLLIVILLVITGKLNSLLTIITIMIIFFIKQVPNLVKFSLQYRLQLNSLWSHFKKNHQYASQQKTSGNQTNSHTTNKQQSQTQNKPYTPPPLKTTMSPLDAYTILDLKPGASQQDIITAHRKLMLKNHPDRGGSHHIATKINLAKKLLLNNNK